MAKKIYLSAYFSTNLKKFTKAIGFYSSIPLYFSNYNRFLLLRSMSTSVLMDAYKWLGLRIIGCNIKKETFKRLYKSDVSSSKHLSCYLLNLL